MFYHSACCVGLRTLDQSVRLLLLDLEMGLGVAEEAEILFLNDHLC